MNCRTNVSHTGNAWVIWIEYQKIENGWTTNK